MVGFLFGAIGPSGGFLPVTETIDKVWTMEYFGRQPLMKFSGVIMPRNETGKICVSIAQKTTIDALQEAQAAQSLADVIEIRLDSLIDAQIAPFVEKIKTPLLFTNRPVWEGGLYEGSEDERVDLLLQAVESGAAYVDIEIRSREKYVQQICREARQGQSQVIVSWHDFDATPGDDMLQDVFKQQLESGAHIGKMVTMARDFTDVLRVLQLQNVAQENNFPLCAFCMGRPGMISRLATLELGGFMTYAAPDSGELTAPGQLTVSELLASLKSFSHADKR